MKNTKTKIQKGHYTLKEIQEGAKTIDKIMQNSHRLEKIIDDIKKQGVYNIYVVGAGSSLSAAHAIAFWLRDNGMVAYAIPSSEFYHHKWPIYSKTLLIAISQSGKTSETLLAAKFGKRNGVAILAITNNSKSPLAKIADYEFTVEAGKEESVISTKFIDAALASGYIISKLMSNSSYADLARVKDYYEEILKINYKPILNLLEEYRGVFVIGSGLDYAGGLELSNKLSEGPMIQSTSLNTFEIGHSPKPMTKYLPTIVITFQPKLESDYLRLTEELREHKAKVIKVGHKNKHFIHNFDISIDIEPHLSPFVITKIGQILSLQLGLRKGYNPDKPHGMHKFVEF